MIVIGRSIDIPGVRTVSWHEPGGLALPPGCGRPRGQSWVRLFVLHATVGDAPQTVRSGAGPSGMAARTVEAWASEGRHAGAHLIVDGDGTVYCLADLAATATYHATSVNEISIGIEVCQSHSLEIWQAELDALILALDRLTLELGVPRQYQWPYRGHPVPRLASGGRDCVGIIGHRDQTEQRGKGDPGDAVYAAMHAAGYLPLDYAAGDDLLLGRERQQALTRRGLLVVPDGVCGPKTIAALRRSGVASGQWVQRPGDP
jgi:hypothetical protein